MAARKKPSISSSMGRSKVVKAKPKAPSRPAFNWARTGTQQGAFPSQQPTAPTPGGGGAPTPTVQKPAAFDWASALKGGGISPGVYDGLPYDQGVAGGLASADLRRTQGINGIDAQQTQGLLDSGFSYNRDINGDGKIDLEQTANVAELNPASKLAMLQRSFADAKRGNSNSMAARGQMLTGAFTRQQQRLRDDQAVGESNLSREVQSWLGGLASARLDVGNEFNDTANGLFGGLAQSLANDPERDPGRAAMAQAGAAATAPAASGPAAAARPSGAGWTGSNVFSQKSGPRAGQWYRVLMRGGKKVRQYQDGFEEK